MFPLLSQSEVLIRSLQLDGILCQLCRFHFYPSPKSSFEVFSQNQLDGILCELCRFHFYPGSKSSFEVCSSMVPFFDSSNLSLGHCPGLRSPKGSPHIFLPPALLLPVILTILNLVLHGYLVPFALNSVLCQIGSESTCTFVIF